MDRNLMMLGSEEWCSLPDLRIPAIKMRIDSGAKTSAIHALNIEEFRKGNERWVKYDIFPIQDNRYVRVTCESKVTSEREIKSSMGFSERRYVIQTVINVGGESWEIELSLANRDSMGFRMLLGREAMINRIIIDPAKRECQFNVSQNHLNKLYKNKQIKSGNLNIGLLASNPDLYSNQRIIQAAEERGHSISFLNITNCYMKLDSEKPEVHYRGGDVLDDFDAVIPRIRPNVTFYGCALIRQFDSVNVYSLNSASAISKSRDKLFSTQLFSKHGINIPITGFANSPIDTNDLIKMVNGAPLIIKLLESTQGKGVVLAETNKAAESVINAFKSLHTNILVQEFIKEAGGKDIRCFVIDGKVIASIQRSAKPGEFRSNIHQGGTASIVKITAEERKLAIKAAKILKLDVAGVDIIRSNKGPLLLEVNSSPGLEGIEKATGKDIASLMIQVIEKKLRKQ